MSGPPDKNAEQPSNQPSPVEPVEPVPPAQLPPPAEPVKAVPSISMSGLASLVTALGFGGFLTIGGLTQLASVPFGLFWTELFLFFGIPYVALRLSGREAFASTGFRRPWLLGCVFGLLLGITNFFAVVAPIQFVAQKLAPKSWVDLYDASKVFQDKSPLELAMIVLGVVVAAPLGEEFFFRGTLQRGWATRMGPIVAIVFTGAVFSAFHLDPIGFPARWELGVLFGLLAWRTGSLWPGIFAHLANNLTSTVLYFALKDQPQDPSEDATSLLAIAGIGGLLMLGVLFLGVKFPAFLKAPSTAEETEQKAAGVGLPLQWAAVGLGAFALLLIFDFRGSVIRGMDMAVPVKHVGPELKDMRERARRGELGLMDYFKARQLVPQHEESSADGGS